MEAQIVEATRRIVRRAKKNDTLESVKYFLDTSGTDWSKNHPSFIAPIICWIV